MTEQPFFSIIIPTFNRPQHLQNCLQSLLQLDYPAGQWEVIVVNDGGKHSFDNITNELRDQLPLKLMTTEHAGPARARNQGVEAASGTYLAFTDDDCQVDSQWLRNFASMFESSNCDALAGKLLNPYTDSIPAEAWTVYMRFLQERIYRDPNDMLLLILSNNAAYKRHVFDQLGGFDERFPFAASEDTEMGFRLVGNKYVQGYCEQAKVWHYHDSSYSAFIKQQFRYGRGDYYFAWILAESGYIVPERKIYGFFQFYRNLLDYSQVHGLPKQMVALLCSTPFVYELGTRYEWLNKNFLKFINFD